ncbi:hypothetical protein TCE0_039f13142 [Talaromyces pinophilus]|uniref:Uncharacterized protein n=1 Tax=Talaromyces pinophilus TaxID=128442 RepID=A0A6N4SLP3_TALPI|nr:hypothetical protein TCE0_039f13142 [Talaromyces pinophilus]
MSLYQRCERLNLPCAGRGQLRYKFKKPLAVLEPCPKTQLTHQSAAFHRWAPPRCLNNETASLASRFVAVLSVTDPRFNLQSLGTWLIDIPSHLGRDRLLDTATAALATAVEDLRIGKQSMATLSSYGKAINCLVKALRDPIKVKEPYTLAAVFMITPWLSLKADYVNHIQGIAHLLNLSAGKEWNSDFAETLRFHLIFPIYVAMAISPNIEVDSWYMGKYAKSYGRYDPSSDKDVPPIRSLDISAIMRYPTLLRNPELYSIELRMRYNQTLLDGHFLRRRLESIDGQNTATEMPNLELQREEAQLRLAYAALLYYSLIMNSYVSALDPYDQSLSTDAILMAEEAVETANMVFRKAPISLGFVPLCLFAASLATTDTEILSDIDAALLDYKDHFIEWHHLERFQEAKGYIDNIRIRRLAYFRGSGCYWSHDFENTQDASSKYLA